MSREIIFEVRKDNKTVWPDSSILDSLYVCGRDDATAYLAQLILDDNIEDNEDDTLFLSYNDKRLDMIKKILTEYYHADLREIDKAEETLEALKEARRYSSYEDFFKFSKSIEETQQWLNNNNYSRAESLIECLDKCINKVNQLINVETDFASDEIKEKCAEHYKIAIILSE